MRTAIRGLVALSFFAATGCQEYEFNPINPVTFRQTVSSEKIVARQYKPNLMLVIDRSQSMDFPMPNGESRWTQLKRAFSTYLTAHGTVARMGLMTFPTGDACGAGSVVVDLWTQNDTPADLQAQASRIDQAIQATRPGGVTPTMDSLKVFTNYAPLQSGRENVVVLATDGLPNCNANNPNSYDVNPAACDCTFAGAMCGGTYTRLSCLDQVGTVSVVRELLAKGIKTAVVGFGADALEGTGPLVMNAIASEGGAARSCPNGTNAECGTGNICDTTTKVCNLRYYQAANETELGAALATIGYDLTKGERCSFQLDVAPTDPRFLSVSLNGTAVQSGASTWTYDSGTVTFVGSACEKLASSTPDDPVTVEFRVLDTL
jgi:hypothetical protein